MRDAFRPTLLIHPETRMCLRKVYTELANRLSEDMLMVIIEYVCTSADEWVPCIYPDTKNVSFVINRDFMTYYDFMFQSALRYRKVDRSWDLVVPGILERTPATKITFYYRNHSVAADEHNEWFEKTWVYPDLCRDVYLEIHENSPGHAYIVNHDGSMVEYGGYVWANGEKYKVWMFEMHEAHGEGYLLCDLKRGYNTRNMTNIRNKSTPLLTK